MAESGFKAGVSLALIPASSDGAAYIFYSSETRSRSGPNGLVREEDPTTAPGFFSKGSQKLSGWWAPANSSFWVKRFNGAKHAYDAVICVWEDGSDVSDLWACVYVCLAQLHLPLRDLQIAGVANSWVFVCLFCFLSNSYRTIVSNFTFSKVTLAFFFDNIKISLPGPIKSLNLVRVLKKKKPSNFLHISGLCLLYLPLFSSSRPWSHNLALCFSTRNGRSIHRAGTHFRAGGSVVFWGAASPPALRYISEAFITSIPATLGFLHQNQITVRIIKPALSSLKENADILYFGNSILTV